MPETLAGVFSRVPPAYLNVLLLVGLSLFGGALSGRLFQKMRIPQVVGYICLGIFLGVSGLRIIDQRMLQAFAPFNHFALGLIGFMIGGELRRDVFLKHNRQFLTILLFESTLPFLLVTLLVGALGTLLFGDWRFSVALGLILGAIANSTAPATTMEVLRETKARGPLTRTVLNTVALTDVSALLFFALASSFAGTLAAHSTGSGPPFFLNPAREIATALAIGIAAGLVLRKLLRKYPERERHLVFCLGAILSATGLAMALHVDMLLPAMAAGCVAANTAHARSREIFRQLEEFTPPIYILFFIMVGAKLNIAQMDRPVLILLLLYLAGAAGGKMSGAWLGARLASATDRVRRYLPFSLFSQAGVSIGLAILAASYFPGALGGTVLMVVTAAVLILEITGPGLLKASITRSGEAGLDVTAGDYAGCNPVREIMDAGPVRLRVNTTLGEILKMIGETSNLYYPVVDGKNRPVGVVSVENVRKILNEEGVGGLILAADIMERPGATVTPGTLLSEAQEAFDHRHLDCLVVVNRDGTLAGFLEKQRVERSIEARILEIQRRVDNLEHDGRGRPECST